MIKKPEWKEFYLYIKKYINDNNYQISLADSALIYDHISILLDKFTMGSKEQNYKIVSHFLKYFNEIN